MWLPSRPTERERWGRAGGAVFFVETQTDVRFLTAVCGIGMQPAYYGTA